MSDHRSWGTTRNCYGCRFWSEMIARCDGGGPVLAACLAQTAGGIHYRPGTYSCNLYQEGSLGAIDDPGGNPYEEEIDPRAAEFAAIAMSAPCIACGSYSPHTDEQADRCGRAKVAMGDDGKLHLVDVRPD